jgi:hypothetical protein
MNYFCRRIVSSAEISTDLRVRTILLVIQRFANIVQQGPSLGDLDIGAQFGGQHPSQVSAFDSVCKLVLAIAGAKVQST